MASIESKIGVFFLGKYAAAIAVPWWSTTWAIHINKKLAINGIETT